MTIRSATTLVTAEEYEAMGDIGPSELIRGKVVPSSHPKPRHGQIARRIFLAVWPFVDAHKLGELYGSEIGYLLERNPDTLRAPDLSFVRSELAATHDDDQWYRHSPDLAVEVRSPGDAAGEVKSKVAQWLAGGAKSVWVVDPKRRTLTIHHPNQTPHVIREDQALRDEAVLPGFEVNPIAQFFGT